MRHGFSKVAQPGIPALRSLKAPWNGDEAKGARKRSIAVSSGDGVGPQMTRRRAFVDAGQARF